MVVSDEIRRASRRRLGARQRWIWSALLPVPVAAFGAIVAGQCEAHARDWIVATTDVIVLGAFLVLAFSTLQLTYDRCSRCRQPFSRWHWAVICRNCGLDVRIAANANEDVLTEQGGTGNPYRDALLKSHRSKNGHERN